MNRRVAESIVRHRRGIAIAWVAAAALLLPSVTHLTERLEVSAHVAGSGSDEVERVLREKFTSPYARYAVLVLAHAPSPATADGAALLRRVTASLDSTPGVANTTSYLTSSDSLFLPRAGGTFMLVGLDTTVGGSDHLLPILRRRTTALQSQLHVMYPALTLRWTGETALNLDVRSANAADALIAERRAMPLVLILLGLAFGSLVAALVPAVAGALAIGLSLGGAAVLALYWPVATLLQNVVSMLGLGLGIDYALLAVGRFREGLAAGLSPHEAAVDTVLTAGHTIGLSALAVAVGFLALLLVPLTELRSVAIGGLLVVTMSAAIATTLLPGVLAALGTRVNAGRLVQRESSAKSEARWRRWGAFVARHPVVVLLVAGAPALLLATQSGRLSTRMPRGNWLPPSMESSLALRDLHAMERGGMVQTMRIILQLPAGVSILEGPGWQAVRALSRRVAADARVERVRSLTDAIATNGPVPLIILSLPAAIRSSMITDDGANALLEVVPKGSVELVDWTTFARELRAMDPAQLTGVAGARVLVGGLPAFNADYDDAINGRFVMIALLVVGGTLLALMVGFRSVLVPIKAVLLNLLSVAGAFGAVVLVFQDGIGAKLIGLDAPVDGVFAAIPLIVFCIVFGLSMDYEVFLVSRIAEARQRGRTDHDALIEGMAHTGGIITSAAAIMIVAFGAFAFAEVLIIRVLGFALAVAILLDATLVRMAVGPALLRLAGDWNWWPGVRK